jgi:hypothetical protein
MGNSMRKMTSIDRENENLLFEINEMEIKFRKLLPFYWSQSFMILWKKSYWFLSHFHHLNSDTLTSNPAISMRVRAKVLLFCSSTAWRCILCNRPLLSAVFVIHDLITPFVLFIFLWFTYRNQKYIVEMWRM